MDDQSLKLLHDAFAKSPGNLRLAMTLVEAYLELGEVEKAHSLLKDGLKQEPTENADRILAARVYLAAGDPEQALTLANDGSASARLVAARALLALSRVEEARLSYRDAVTENATLEDPEFEKILADETPLQSEPGTPRLRLIPSPDESSPLDPSLFTPPSELVRFEDVGGLEGVKKQIHRRIILPFQKPSLMQRFRKKAGGGILLYGPPGCGKTLLARATAGECGAAFINIAISDVLDMWLGEPERKLHEIFDEARRAAPCVLFFDELEALAGKRQHNRASSQATSISQLLSEMDGFSGRNPGVLILGATNVPWAVDPAFRRPGRFDRVLFVPPPDQKARECILELLLRDRPAAPDLPLAKIAKRCSGFSGADLMNLVETAVDLAIEASLEADIERPIDATHFRAALDEVNPSSLDWLTTARNYARYANEGGTYDEVLDFMRKHGKG